MRVAIASDIHGNKQAFQAVIAAAEAAGAEELWCLGDLVGYGARARRVRGAGRRALHDLPRRQPRPRRSSSVLSLDDFSRGAALAAHWTREVIRPETREYLLSLSPQASAEGVGLFHASPRDPVWEYVLSACRRAVLRRRPTSGSRSSGTRTWRCRSTAPRASRPRARRGARATRSTSTTRRVADQPGHDRPAARRRPARRLADARHRTPGPPPGGAPSTTSRAPRPRSAPRTCPTRSPSGCNTGSDRVRGR